MTTNESLVLDAPRLTRQDRGNRLSFLRRNQPEPVPQTNGNGHSHEQTSRDSSSTRSRSKDNTRKSFFGSTSSRVDGDHGDGGADWVTESGGARRSSSSQRPDTAISVGSAVDSVRKRFSMLKLGKKTSKASVVNPVGSVVEEE